MKPKESTSWELIQGAAAREGESSREFARRYEPLVRAYLVNRWQATDFLPQVADATQEVFLECFRHGGILDRVDRERVGGFRAFLYGVTRNVARRFEDRKRRNRELPAPPDFEPRPDESTRTPSQQMDREWALAILKAAEELMEENAREKGEAALRRLRLLRLRFENNLPIREIARRWQTDLIPLHQDYMKASREFKAALREVLYPGLRVHDDLLQQEVGRIARLLQGR